jgi:hypothetical protein
MRASRRGVTPLLRLLRPKNLRTRRSDAGGRRPRLERTACNLLRHHGRARGRRARGQRPHADASWEAGGDDAAARQGRPARRSRHHCEDGAPRQRAPTAEASRSPRPFASVTRGGGLADAPHPHIATPSTRGLNETAALPQCLRARQIARDGLLPELLGRLPGGRRGWRRARWLERRRLDDSSRRPVPTAPAVSGELLCGVWLTTTEHCSA